MKLTCRRAYILYLSEAGYFAVTVRNLVTFSAPNICKNIMAFSTKTPESVIYLKKQNRQCIFLSVHLETNLSRSGQIWCHSPSDNLNMTRKERSREIAGGELYIIMTIMINSSYVLLSLTEPKANVTPQVTMGR